MRVPLVLAAAAAIAAGSYLASAAALGGIGSTRAGAGNSSIAKCDADGFTVGYTLSGSNVDTVTVGGIADPGCEGASVTATLTDGSSVGIGSGSGTVPSDPDTTDNSITITVSPTPAESTLVGIQLSFRGP